MKPSEVAAEAVIWGLIEAEAKHRKDAARASQHRSFLRKSTRCVYACCEPLRTNHS